MKIEPGDLDRSEFLETFGSVFEQSPWIAENVWNDGLDTRHDTAAGMHEVMCNEIRQADLEQKLELLRAHPQLACAISREGLSKASRGEQRRSGLEQCTEEEFAGFKRLNAAYQEKFGFPFILAIKGFQRKQILEIFRNRLKHSPEEEFQAALAQVMRIGLFRLQEIME
ncbi:MAG: 2-oxo-4-hydroxy-4-carboxy-5-ureidoimidazoline decarboxylase [Lysobacterales bacterium]